MKILNANDLKAVSASYAGDEAITFNGANELVTTNDGYPYFVSDVMNSVIDVKANKYSFFGLTSAMNTTDLVEDLPIEIKTVGPIALNLPLSGDLVLGVDSQTQIDFVDITDDEAILITLDHVDTLSGDNYYILNYRDKVLTLDVTDEIFFGTFNNGVEQQFKVVDGGTDNIKFQTADVRFANWNGSELFRAVRDFQYIDLYDETSTEFSGYDTTNKWVRYENFYAPEYSTTTSVLTVDDANSISGVPTNFVLNAPFESITIDGATATIPFDMIPTKNFKTISSELSLIPTSGISGTDLVDFREYNRLFTGGNQIGGYANINLGYSSDYSSVITFKGDKFTYFHFPRTAPEITIQEAGLEFAGAFAGVIPEFSDRIYKKLANYEDMVWWGGGSHNGSQDGTWLCAWLSGGEGDNSAWVERYYNPGLITSEGALSAGGGAPTFEYEPNAVPYWDVESTMTLEPGAYYRYYHVGNGGFERILDSLKGETDDNIVIQLTDFTLGNVVDDESNNSNDGFISNYDNADEVTLDIGFGTEGQSAILLNGDSEVRVNSSPTLNVTDNKSISTWQYLRDWQNGRSATLFSNYYKGGDKFEYMNHGLYYSYMVPNAGFNAERYTVIPSEVTLSGSLINTNTSLSGESVIPKSVAVDLDGFLWMASYKSLADQTVLLKLTSSGQVLESINFKEFEAKQLLIQNDNHGYMIDVDGTVKKFNLSTGDEIPGTPSIPSTDYAYISFTGELSAQGGNVLDMDTYNDGTLCTIQDDGGVGVRLHIGTSRTEQFTGQTPKHVVCDDDNYCFVTTYDSSNIRLYMYERNDEATISEDAIAVNTPASSAVNAPFITKESVDGVVQTVVYWVGETTLNRYFINEDNELQLIVSLNTEQFVGDINGDFSGYKLNKVISLVHNGKPYLKYSVLLDNDSTEPKFTMCHSAVDLSDNWHYFTITKDTEAGLLSLYIDSVLDIEETNIFDPIWYLTGSMLNIGGASDGSDPLFEQLGLTNRDIDGGVSEFSIFSITLDANDVSSLYLSKFSGNDKMEWVVNNGKKNFVEEFQNVFKFKKPGIKSQFLNVIVKNLDLTDEEKEVYEVYIRTEIVGSLPANVKMVNIIWR